MIKWFKDISSSDINTCGGKATSLWELMRAWFPSSDGFVLSTKAYGKSCNTRKNEVFLAFDQLNTKYVAVRSSATKEDWEDDSFAGQLDTYLFVDRENLIEQIMKCHNSISSNRIKTYCESKNIDINDIQVAVVVQKMINSEVAWIAFTVDPITNNTDQITIEWWYGLGGAVVSWMITPDRYLWSKSKQEIVKKSINTQSKKLIVDIDKWWIKEKEVENTSQSIQKLSDTHIQELAKMSEEIEKHYEKPMDIEWSLEDGNLYVLQARPITTLKTDTSLTRLYSKQISLTERLSDVEGFDVESFREADISKRERLDFLQKHIWLPYQKPHTFTYEDVMHDSDEYKEYVSTYRWKIAVRFASSNSKNKKYRTRGIALQNLPTWLGGQWVHDTKTYSVQIRPHFDKCDFSATFFVGENNIYWEYVQGGHHILTQGFYDTNQRPIFFSFDFDKLHVSRNNVNVKYQIEKMFECISVKEIDVKKTLQSKWVKFSNNYIQGYFEVISYPNQWITFNDWNTLLKDMLDIKQHINTCDMWWTVVCWDWILHGEVVIVNDLDAIPETKDKILVCTMTSPEYLPLMKQAKAIITQRGWVLSHAAIVCRELRLPCIVGYDEIFNEIIDWDFIEFNANTWAVKKVVS